MEFTISEDIEIVANGKRILLEEGDKIKLEGNNHVEQLKALYKRSVEAGDTEKASEIATFLSGIGVNLD